MDLTPREVLEEGAMFLGLVLLQNKLKVETAPVLAALHQADITTVMITGKKGLYGHLGYNLHLNEDHVKDAQS